MPRVPKKSARKKPAGGATRPISDEAARRALSRFRKRTTDLVLAYVAAGRLTKDLARTTLALKQDIESWHDRTGRPDFGTREMTLTKPPDERFRCSHCNLLIISLGRLCFLVACEPQQRYCKYACFEPPVNGSLRP